MQSLFYKRVRYLAISFLIAVLAAFTFEACATKEMALNTSSMAANRKMGVTIRSMKMSDASMPNPNLKVYFEKLTLQSLEQTYGAKAVSVPYAGENVPLEDPENLYAIGSREIDDYFLIDVVIRGPFQVPTSAPSSTTLKPEELIQGTGDQAADVSGMVYNGSNLRAVTLFKLVVPTIRPEIFENAYMTLMKRSLMQALSNPNIYPRSSPEHFGNLLYSFSQTREKDYGDTLDCDNAVDVLKYYPKAQQLYEMAAAKGTTKAVGQQSETYQLSQRIEEATSKSKLLQICQEEVKTGFKVIFDYGKVSAEGIPAIEKAYAASGLETVLAQYTKRPVHLRFQIEPNNDLSLFLSMRFDRGKYLNWINALKIPNKMGPFQIVSLDPYKALMQKLVVFRSSLPNSASAPLRTAFTNMKMTINMTTLQNGEIAFAADGAYQSDKNFVKMKYPNGLIITAPGFPSKTIAGKNNAIFQDKGWMAIGNCKTLDGTLTEDGLLYKFFGFNCQ